MAADRRDTGRDGPRGIRGRVVNAVVGSVVSPVVDNVDVDEVVERIDVNQLLARVDVDELIGRIDVTAVLDRIDVNGLLDRVEPDQLLDRVDPDRLLDRVDPNRLLDRVDPNRLLDRVDPDRLLDRVDPDRLLDRVDPARLLDRVDPEALLARVDVDGLVGRVDLDAVMERVDVNRLVERTEIGAVIARSTSGVFTQLLDVVRTKTMVVDQLVHAVAGRILHRPDRGLPATPSDPLDRPVLRGQPRRQAAIALQLHYAGAVSRFLAFLLDQFIASVLFGLGFALTSSAIEVVLGRTLDPADHRVLVAMAFLLWEFLYLAVPLAVTGRTMGKATLGLIVVRASGEDVRPRDAALRTICFPLSFLLFGAGFLLGLVRADRRQLHDLLGHTAVLYAWDARTADLRAEGSSYPAPASPHPPAT
jgi:uncharacterized RDD family membrane protein YckC